MQLKANLNTAKIFTSFFGRNRAVLPCLLVLATFIVYFPTFKNQLLDYWDDQWVVMNHYTENGFKSTNLIKIVSEYYHGQYAPINQLLYILLYHFFGYQPFWYHCASLGIHLLNVLMVFYFIKRLLTLSRFDKTEAISRIAFFTSLLFAIHPFLVEAVAWQSASKIILYSLFYLLALHAYLSFYQSSNFTCYLIALLCFVLAFGAKEQAVTLPVCFILVDCALKRNLKKFDIWLEKLPFIILALSFGIFTMLSQSVTGTGPLSDSLSYPFYQKLIFASYSFLEYFFKCIIPYKLSYLYPFPNPPNQSVALRFWLYPFALFIGIVCLWSFWSRRWISFGLMFFAVHICIVLHFVSLSRFAIIADRYVYMASIGVFFTLSYLFESMLTSKLKLKNIIVILSLVYACFLGVYANSYVRIWHDTDTLKQHFREVLHQRTENER